MLEQLLGRRSEQGLEMAEEMEELFGYVGDEEERRRMGGSFEITEMLLPAAYC